MLIIIEVLLNLNKLTNSSSIKRFAFIKYCFNKRFILLKLTTSSNTTNPFFKCDIRLSVINSSIMKTFHHTNSFFFSCFISHSRFAKSFNKIFSYSTVFFSSINTFNSNFFTCTNSIFNSYAFELSSKSKFNSFSSTILIYFSKFSFIKTTRNMSNICCNIKIIIYNTIRNTRTLRFFCTFKKSLSIFIKFSITLKQIIKTNIHKMMIKCKFCNIITCQKIFRNKISILLNTFFSIINIIIYKL